MKTKKPILTESKIVQALQTLYPVGIADFRSAGRGVPDIYMTTDVYSGWLEIKVKRTVTNKLQLRFIDLHGGVVVRFRLEDYDGMPGQVVGEIEYPDPGLMTAENWGKVMDLITALCDWFNGVPAGQALLFRG
jgi:hypothetical protein